MKKTKIIAALLALVMLISVFAGCTKTEQPSAPESSAPESTFESTGITLTDMSGKEITLEKPAEKIVVLTAADCEIIYAIGAGDKVIGRGEYCDWPAEALEVQSVQSGYETNIEQIIALEPDVVFTGVMDQSEEQLKQLESAGIKVIVSNANTIDETYVSIEMIGKATGKNDEAAACIDGMNNLFAELKAKVTESEKKPTVYFEVSPLQYGLWTAGSGTFMNEVAELIGAENCFADVEGWAEISEEQVLERNPDYIVTIAMYYGEGPTPEEEIVLRTGWQNVNAVKNGAILNLMNNELSRPAPRLADGTQMLFDLIYGTQE